MLAAVNLRGVGESVKLNVVLTIVEITGLMLVIVRRALGVHRGAPTSTSPASSPSTPSPDKNTFLAVTTATSLAFFAMVGFEDSVNMAEETKDPVKIFPKVLLTGLAIAGVVYVVVAIVAVALVPVGTLAESETPLVEVVKAGAPGLPIDDDPAVHLDVRGRQHRADQHADGEPADLRHGPAARAAAGAGHGAPAGAARPWVAIIFTTLIAFGLIFYVTAFANDKAISGARRNHVAAAARGVRGGQRRGAGAAPRRAGRRAGHFRTPTVLPVVGFLTSLYLVLPLSGRPASSTCWRASCRHRHRAVLHHHGDQPPRRGHRTRASPIRRIWARRRIK